MLSEMAKNGDKLNFGQDFFVKFYQAFLYSDRWQQYFKGVGTTLLVTAIALVLGVVLLSVLRSSDTNSGIGSFWMGCR